MPGMTDDEIRERFDNDWNMTVARLAEISGRTVEDVKRVLMEEPMQDGDTK